MISPIGYFLIPAALVIFVRGRRTLLWATLALVPFTAVQVIDIGVTTIAGFQFFGVLFIARCLIDTVWSGSRGLERSRANALAALFLFVCFASLSMAVIKAGTVEVYTETQGRWIDVVRNSGPLQFSTFNLTQILYPTFGILLFHFLVRELRSVADLRKTINILVGGALVIAVMSIASGALYTMGRGGLYEQVLGLFSVGPPGAKNPESASIGEFLRMYTLAGEPGFTAMTLLAGAGLVAGDVLRSGESVIRQPTIKLFILGAALLFNGSTTGYFGAGLLILWAIMALWYVGRGSLGTTIRALGVVLGSLVLIAALASTIQVSGLSFYEWLTEYHLAKLQGEGVGSGQIRSYVTWYTLETVFLSSPILGVGYGSHLSLSLVTFLLANVGLVGFGVFLAFLYTAFRNARKTARSAQGPLRKMAFMAAVVFVPFLTTLFVAKATSGINYGLTWTIIALAEVTYQVHRRQRRRVGRRAQAA